MQTLPTTNSFLTPTYRLKNSKTVIPTRKDFDKSNSSTSTFAFRRLPFFAGECLSFNPINPDNEGSETFSISSYFGYSSVQYRLLHYERYFIKPRIVLKDDDDLIESPQGSGSTSGDDDRPIEESQGSGSTSGDDDRPIEEPQGSGSTSGDDDRPIEEPQGSGSTSGDDDRPIEESENHYSVGDEDDQTL